MSKGTKRINLALQGGGAHGAFTWGVLDAFLEDGRLLPDGITATSAGSMNAAVMTHGYAIGGVNGARQLLQDFWRAVSGSGSVFAPVQGASAVSHALFESMTHVLSPYQFNPMNYNPLRDILGRIFEGNTIRTCPDIKLFVAATNVRTGTPRIFYGEQVTIDAILASAALPQIFQAVEIGGEHYWDGGYMGNPALWPLFYEAKTPDILIVHVNPIQRATVPMDAEDISNRINEITFNAALLKEMRAVAFVKKLVKDEMLKDDRRQNYRDILIHAIKADDAMADLSLASKYDTSWPFLLGLRDEGRKAAFAWLDKNFKHIGNKDTVDIQKEYLGVDKKGVMHG